MNGSHLAPRFAKLFLALAIAATVTSCANFIKEESTVIWDRVEGTDDLKVHNLAFDGAMAKLHLTYLCERKQFAVTNIYETAYNPAHEVYEVPVGLVAVIPSFVWYLGSSIVTLGSVTPEIARGPMYWSVAGLNPLTPVENGMFTDRYSIREKGGSRRPQDGSKADPYDAPVSVHRGELELRFIDPDGHRTPWRTVQVGEELLVEINLLEAAETFPSAATQKVEARARVKPSSEMSVARKEVVFFLPPELAQRLYEARPIMELRPQKKGKKERQAAMEQLSAMGFGREAAALLQR